MEIWFWGWEELQSILWKYRDAGIYNRDVHCLQWQYKKKQDWRWESASYFCTEQPSPQLQRKWNCLSVSSSMFLSDSLVLTCWPSTKKRHSSAGVQLEDGEKWAPGGTAVVHGCVPSRVRLCCDPAVHSCQSPLSIGVQAKLQVGCHAHIRGSSVT